MQFSSLEAYGKSFSNPFLCVVLLNFFPIWKWNRWERREREREKKGNFLLRLLKTCTYILTRTINISQENKRCIVLNYDRSKMNRGLSSQTQTFIVRIYNLRGGHQYLLLNFEGWTWNLDYTVNVVIYYSLTDFGCHTLCNTYSLYRK